jgi:putative phage-type endonuclease
MIEQGTVEWFAERAGHVTASRAADMLAKIKEGEAAGRKTYRTKLVVERLTGRPANDDSFTSGPMERGTEKEPAARSWYMNKRDVLVTQMGFTRHKTIPWVGCSPDSEVEDGVGGLEIKCPNTSTHIENLFSGKSPAKYFKQMQFQMMVMNWQWVDFVSYDDRLPEHLHGCIYRLVRDPLWIETTLMPELTKFLAEVAEDVERLKNYKG